MSATTQDETSIPSVGSVTPPLPQHSSTTEVSGDIKTAANERAFDFHKASEPLLEFAFLTTAREAARCVTIVVLICCAALLFATWPSLPRPDDPVALNQWNYEVGSRVLLRGVILVAIASLVYHKFKYQAEHRRLYFTEDAVVYEREYTPFFFRFCGVSTQKETFLVSSISYAKQCHGIGNLDSLILQNGQGASLVVHNFDSMHCESAMRIVLGMIWMKANGVTLTRDALHSLIFAGELTKKEGGEAQATPQQARSLAWPHRRPPILLNTVALAWPHRRPPPKRHTPKLGATVRASLATRKT